MKRNKYAATIPAALVNDGTEAQLGNAVRRGGAELLGVRKLKNGSMQVGFSATAAQRRNTGAMLDAYFKNSVEYKDCGVDDGVRKSVSKCETPPAKTVKEKSKPKPKIEKPVERVNTTVQHLYRNYPPLGSDQHKRVVELIGTGCEDPCAYIAIAVDALEKIDNMCDGDMCKFFDNTHHCSACRYLDECQTGVAHVALNAIREKGGEDDK